MLGHRKSFDLATKAAYGSTMSNRWEQLLQNYENRTCTDTRDRQQIL